MIPWTPSIVLRATWRGRIVPLPLPDFAGGFGTPANDPGESGSTGGEELVKRDDGGNATEDGEEEAVDDEEEEVCSPAGGKNGEVDIKNGGGGITLFGRLPSTRVDQANRRRVWLGKRDT